MLPGTSDAFIFKQVTIIPYISTVSGVTGTFPIHHNDVIMGTIASQITSLTIVYSIVYSDTDQRKHQSSASLAFVREIHRGPVNSPHKWPVTRKMFPSDDVIMMIWINCELCVINVYEKRGHRGGGTFTNRDYNIDIRACINNYINTIWYDVIAHPNFKYGLPNPPWKLGHGWAITSHRISCM